MCINRLHIFNQSDFKEMGTCNRVTVAEKTT